MISHKEVIRQIRKNVYFKNYDSYSDRRKNHQRVKFFGVSENENLVEEIQHFLLKNHYGDISIEEISPSKYSRIINNSVVIKFPYNLYN